MSSMNTTITLQTSENRPCEVDGIKALFHRWGDKDLAFVRFDTALNPEVRASIVEQIREEQNLPAHTSMEIVRQTVAIVEFEDGQINEVEPKKVRFMGNYAYLKKEKANE